ncbi:MAG: L,D-transpeptidase, partial [Actinomycetota bacterium]|nr:L,D-transpeptidase [Actinomycetota bacterium]
AGAAARSTPASRPASRDTARSSTPSPERTALPVRSGTGRRIVYSISRQRVWLVAGDGDVQRTYLVSGQASQPDPGRYRVYSKSRHTSSAVSPATMQYMVRFAVGEDTGAAVGFHDIPRHRDGTYEQTEAQLGEPLSAGCVRQRRADARALWDFAPVGTAVVVTR